MGMALGFASDIALATGTFLYYTGILAVWERKGGISVVISYTVR